ncbi:hypothetical protein [Streptomyces sp. RG80]|uniref:hypothetical protein n=1 Tax=Streptomyces sp. RG80 TaxID=3157340 RepID=UPI00338EC6F0
MTPPERPVPEHVLARSVIAPLGGLLEVGAVTATGTWSLSDASVGAYVERRRSEVDRLLAGIHTVGGFGPVFMAVLDELGYLRDHEVALRCCCGRAVWRAFRRMARRTGRTWSDRRRYAGCAVWRRTCN